MRSKYELRASKELESDGWRVDWKIHPFRTPKGYQVDYFGLFDLMAYFPRIIRFIAVKGHCGVPGPLRKGIEQFEVCDHIVKEIWTYRKLKGDKKESVKKEIIK